MAQGRIWREQNMCDRQRIARMGKYLLGEMEVSTEEGHEVRLFMEVWLCRKKKREMKKKMWYWLSQSFFLYECTVCQNVINDIHHFLCVCVCEYVIAFSGRTTLKSQEKNVTHPMLGSRAVCKLHFYIHLMITLRPETSIGWQGPSRWRTLN